jgi:hypothetical protein
MDISQNNGASAPPAGEQVWRAEEAVAGGNLVEGNPSAGSTAPQAQTQAAQNTALTTNREAGARGWDPAAVDGMLQEVEESTATLLPEAEQVLLELEEEARANWEERAVYHAMQVTNFAGEAFETLSENRWSRRDCTEYQEELDWAMRAF